MRYQLMKRSVVLFAVLLSGPLAGVGQADEAAAIAEIEKLGGAVRQIANDSEAKEAAFHLSGKDLTDAGLVWLKEVQNLIWLNLANTKITDAGLAEIAGIKSLTRLHLEKTQIGDAGLQHLTGLENLEYLNLYGTQVSDNGLASLKALPKLKKIYLWESKVTLDGAKTLQSGRPDLYVNLGAEFEKPAEAKALASGQYVRVRLEGDDRILQLAEVQVFEKGTGAELQKSGTARQSSNYSDAEAKRASDGNTDQDYNKGSVSHTNSEKDPWWVLDLGSVKEIESLKIYNRGDCCGDRLKDAVVDVLDASLKVVWSGKIAEVKDASVTEFVATAE